MPDPGDDLAGRYVRLGLRLDRVAPGLVDAHLGDPDVTAALAREVAAEPRRDPDVLRRDAAELRREVTAAGLGDDDRGRARAAFLDAQLGALETVAGRAAGRELGVVDEVRACLGVAIGPGDTDGYAAVHDRLEALLPGPGPLAGRLAAHRADERVPPERLADAVEALRAALRERTASAIGLPEGESVAIEVVPDAAWSGFSRHRGGFASTVSVNAAAPQRASALALLVAHEAYPGHHTEAVRTEAGLRSGAAPPERALLLARTPQSLVAEGTAELALEALVGPGWGTWTAEVLAPVLGRRGDGELAEAVERAMDDLAGVRQDAVLLLHGAGTDGTERALAHLRRWLLVDDARARRIVRFAAHPRWRIHTSTYVEGVRTIRPWLAARPEGQPLVDRFARLLDEPWTPSTLCVPAAAA